MQQTAGTYNGGGKIGSPKHSASGPACGYFFQLERALYWLSTSKSNSMVGIETDDDVAIRIDDEIILEQDKCSTVPDGYPFSDRSVNLWKTLYIWINAIKEKNVETDTAKFYLITNKERTDCLAKRLGKFSKDEDDIRQCIDEVRQNGNEILLHINDLKKEGKSPKSKLDDYVKNIIECDDTILYGLIKNVIYLDGATTNNVEVEIASALHIPVELPQEEIIQQLKGWLFDKIMALWQANRPAWIKRNELDRRLWQIRCSYLTKVFNETATKDLFPVSDEDRNSNLSKPFVRQLLILDLERRNDDNIIVEAIADYLHCHSERTRYAQEGLVTRDQFTEFDKNLEIRWSNIFNKYKTQIGKERWNCEEVIGSRIFFETKDHREDLAGQRTNGFYLTSGTYHMLSDEKRVGWHPRFRELL